MLHRTLDNGLEVAVKENHFSKMVTIQCWVGAGSLHESSSEYGMAHCLEHMLFKGTERHGVGEISAKVEACGGDMNAYTTFDHTVYYLNLSSQYAEQGIDLLSDAVLHSSFDADELMKEKEVILEEIRRGLDNPANIIGRKIFETIYSGSPAARPIIGFPETVEKFTRDDLLAFYKTWYQPGNMKVVAVGDFDATQMFSWISKAFGAAKNQAVPAMTLHEPEGLDATKVHVIRGDYEQPRLEIAFAGPKQNDIDAIELDLAAFSLGSGEASRLVRHLRDEKSIASSVGASLYAPDFGGIFELSAIPNSETDLVACAHDLAYNVALMKYHNPVSSNELKRARMNLKADRMYGEETVSGQARAIGHALTTAHKMAYDAVYEARVHASNSETIHNALHRWLGFDKAFIVALVPDSFVVNEDDLKKAYDAGIEKAKQEFPLDPFKTIAKAEGLKTSSEIFEKQIAPGIQFVYRENQSSDFFNLIAVTQGGLRFEDKSTAGLHYCLAEMLATQTSELSHEDLTELIEGSGSVLNGFSGKDSLGLRLQCFTENISDMLPVWADCLLQPVFSDLHWKNLQHDVADEIRAEQDSPAALAVRRFSELIYGDHPYRYPVYGLWDNIAALNPKILAELYAKQRDAGPWTISGVGSLPANDAFDMVSAALKSWRPAETRQQPRSHIELRHNTPAQRVKIEKNREQTHVIVGTLGRSLDDPDRYAIDVLTTVFGGSGGRLFVNLRDQKSLAYTVTPIMSYGCEKGLFGVYIACAPGKVEEAKRAIFDEFSQISAAPVSSEELTRAKNYLVGGHEASMERGESQAMSMGLMTAYGVGATDFLEYSQHIQQVTAADVQRVALALLDPSRMTIVEVGQGEMVSAGA